METAIMGEQRPAFVIVAPKGLGRKQCHIVKASHLGTAFSGAPIVLIQQSAIDNPIASFPTSMVAERWLGDSLKAVLVQEAACLSMGVLDIIATYIGSSPLTALAGSEETTSRPSKSESPAPG